MLSCPQYINSVCLRPTCFLRSNSVSITVGLSCVSWCLRWLEELKRPGPSTWDLPNPRVAEFRESSHGTVVGHAWCKYLLAWNVWGQMQFLTPRRHWFILRMKQMYSCGIYPLLISNDWTINLLDFLSLFWVFLHILFIFYII